VPSNTIDVSIPIKKAYVQPKLTEFGEVARLSQSGGSKSTETGESPKKVSTCL
jgi:hypothetical protein